MLRTWEDRSDINRGAGDNYIHYRIIRFLGND